MTSIRDMILIVLCDGDVYGTQHLAHDLINTRDVNHVRKIINELEEQGTITVIRNGPGRGRRNIIRRNRNSPGYPRKTQ